MSVIIRSQSDDQTRRLGEALAGLCLPGDVLALVGPLGAGKTTFTQGLARGLGVGADTYVNSPTFTIINRYDGKLPIYHLDFYRLEDPDELIETGYDDLLASGAVVVIEWFDSIPEAAPSEYLHIRFTIENENRELKLTPIGENWTKRLAEFKPPKELSA